METIGISMKQLFKISFKLFRGMGYSERDATYAADVLTETNHRGVDTHGVARIDFYHMQTLSNDKVNKDAKLEIIRDESPFLMLDAQRGLGIVMAPQAVELALNHASERGICVMGIRNSNHFGAAGYYAGKCAKQGFVSMVCSNSGPTMVPFGGKQRILGNSPWSIALPGGNRNPNPIMFDMACSEVSRGKLETALREDHEVPYGWGVDENGEACTDPSKILFGGSLLPFGGVKGYCIAVLVELLSSMLTFSSFNEPDSSADRINTSHFVLLMDPSRFGNLDQYKASIDDYVDKIRNSQPATDVKEILIPGELESRYINERSLNGMTLDMATADMLAEIARKTGQLSSGQDFNDMLVW